MERLYCSNYYQNSRFDRGFIMEYIIFNLAQQNYAVPVQNVQEVDLFSTQALAELPQVPDFIEGVMNLRGDVIPIINLRKRLKMKQTDTEKRIVILKKDQVAGILVDTVYHVVNIEEIEIQSPPEGLENAYVTSVWNNNGNVVFLLDIHKVLYFKIDSETKAGDVA